MILKLHSHRLQSGEEIRAFLSGATIFEFESQSHEEAYEWIRDSLQQLRHQSLGKTDRGVVKRYLQNVTGLSLA